MCDYQAANDTTMTIFLWGRLFLGSVGLTYGVIQKSLMPGFSLKFF